MGSQSSHVKFDFVRFGAEHGGTSQRLVFCPEFCVQVTCRSGQVDCDATLTTNSNSWSFADLAWMEADDNHLGEGIQPCLGFIFFESEPLRFLILGIDRLLEVDANQGAREVFALNRFLGEDRGWLFVKGLPVEGGMVILYENGVFYVTENLEVEWHLDLMRDDSLVRIDETYLYFWAEYRTPQEFRIEIQSGAVLNE